MGWSEIWGIEEVGGVMNMLEEGIVRVFVIVIFIVMVVEKGVRCFKCVLDCG